MEHYIFVIINFIILTAIFVIDRKNIKKFLKTRWTRWNKVLRGKAYKNI